MVIQQCVYKYFLKTHFTQDLVSAERTSEYLIHPQCQKQKPAFVPTIHTILPLPLILTRVGCKQAQSPKFAEEEG